jgi:hypothetical protein
VLFCGPTDQLVTVSTHARPLGMPLMSPVPSAPASSFVFHAKKTLHTFPLTSLQPYPSTTRLFHAIGPSIAVILVHVHDAGKRAAVAIETGPPEEFVQLVPPLVVVNSRTRPVSASVLRSRVVVWPLASVHIFSRAAPASTCSSAVADVTESAFVFTVHST